MSRRRTDGLSSCHLGQQCIQPALQTTPVIPEQDVADKPSGSTTPATAIMDKAELMRYDAIQQ